MQKFLFTSISAVLLASSLPSRAEDSAAIFAAPCSEWKSSTPIDMEALDKLKKDSVNERPANGLSQTKKQFVVLLGKNTVGAKDTLAHYKDKLPKTSEGKVDLRDVTLNGFNLSGMNLDNVDLSGAELNGADLSGATLRGALLHKTELQGANLNNADLAHATATKTRFTNASLCQATLAYTELEDATFTGAYVKSAKFDMAKNVPKVIYLNADGVLHFGLPVPKE